MIAVGYGRLQVVSEVGADRRDARCRAVAKRAGSAEQPGGFRTPVGAPAQARQDGAGGHAVASAALIARGQLDRQQILVNPTSAPKGGHDRPGHLGVVGPVPYAAGQPALRDAPAGVPSGELEEAAERVASATTRSRSSVKKAPKGATRIAHCLT